MKIGSPCRILLLILILDRSSQIQDKVKVKGTESRLYQDLFKEYNYDSRPVKNANNTVLIQFGLALNQILDLEEKHQVLSTAVWIYESWYDENLLWDTANYSGLDTLIIPSTKIWLPDLFLFNTAGENLDGFVNVTGSKVMVNHDGRVIWMIPIMLKSSCGVDVTYFPYDYQKCQLRFGSWIYDISQVDMRLNPEVVDVSGYIVNSEYDLINVSMNRKLVDGSCCPGGGIHAMISIFIHVKRKSLYYDYIVIAPTIMLCFMTLFTFFLPCHKGEKIAIGLTVFLTLYVVQLFIAENVPDTNSTPILGVFLLMVMTFNCVSLIMATIIMNIKKRGEEERCADVPKWLLWLCHVVLSKIALTSFIWEKPESLSEGHDNNCLEPETIDPNQNGDQTTTGDTTDKNDNNENITDTVTRVRNRKFVTEGERSDVVTEPMLPKSRIRACSLQSFEHTLYRRRQWFFVAEVVDKFSFLLYLISMSFSVFMVLFVIPHYFSDAQTTL